MAFSNMIIFINCDSLFSCINPSLSWIENPTPAFEENDRRFNWVVWK